MIKAIKASLLLCFIVQLSGCIELDESTMVTDDNGYLHRTKHFLNDKRGREYFPKQIKPMSEKLFIFDPREHAWAAYDQSGDRVMTGSASGGKSFCEDIGKQCLTAVGTFHIYHKKGEDCRSGEYPVDTKGGAKMPYCMYFYRGFTIHAAYEVPDFNTSHGCVRVLPSAAKWLNEEFMTIGTKVVVMDYPVEEAYPSEDPKAAIEEALALKKTNSDMDDNNVPEQPKKIVVPVKITDSQNYEVEEVYLPEKIKNEVEESFLAEKRKREAEEADYG